MTPVMLRAKSSTINSGRVVGVAGCVSDDEEGALTAVETSTPNRHTLASSGVGPGVQRTFVGNGTSADPASSSSIQSRRYHSKSLSLSEGKTLAKAFETPSLRLCTFSGSSQVFQQNRNLWEKRTGESEQAGDRNSRNAAPDLVLDLPAANSVSSSSSNSSSSLLADGGGVEVSSSSISKDVVDGPASPDGTEEGSGADCFASNQYTLKKNDKFLSLESSRHNFSLDNNGSDKEQQPSELGDKLHISEDVGIAERNTHKFITQFADLKLTGGSLPLKGGVTSASAGTETTEQSTSSSSSSSLAMAFKPILRREKPQILRKPVLGSTSGPSSLVGSGASGVGTMMSFNAKGSSGGGDGGAKSLE